jgi:hypothetical protein
VTRSSITVGDDRLEKTIFSLREGEVSEVVDTAEGLVVVKCVKRVPPDTSVSFDQRRPALEKEVFEKKVAMEIGKVFKEMRDKANPKNLLVPANDPGATTRQLLSTGDQVGPVNAQGQPLARPQPGLAPVGPKAGVAPAGK